MCHRGFRELVESEGIALRPGAREWLAFVSELGIPLGLATSSGPVAVQERLGDFLHLFAAVATRADVEHGKPHPDLYFEAARRLGIAPETAIAVEDSPAGTQAALAAGMQVVVVPDLVAPPDDIAPQFSGGLPITRRAARGGGSGVDARSDRDEREGARLASARAIRRSVYRGPAASTVRWIAPSPALDTLPRGLVTDSLGQKLQSTLGSAYTLERELGGGGMSRVFVADESALGRKVVVKVLAPELADGDQRRAVRARDPARRAAAAAEHRPACSPPATSDGLPYYTMPFVDGESLRARLARGARCRSPRRSASCATSRARSPTRTSTASCTATSSRRTCCSPAARRSSPTSASPRRSPRRARRPTRHGSATLTQLGTSLGTPAYMAPEQAAGDPNTDHRADLYALGVVAYELLAGAQPFADRTTPQQLLAAHMREIPPSLADAATRRRRRRSPRS